MEQAVPEILSPEQLAQLSPEQVAVFESLSPKDRKFFAAHFKSRDLSQALDRKAEIIKRDRARKAQSERIRAAVDSVPQNAPSGESVGEIVTAAAGALGVGAAAVVIASDSTASWQGVAPADLVGPLRTEFSGDPRTGLSVTGAPDTLIATVLLASGGGMVPALSINLTSIAGGTEVKVGELTSQGVLTTVKEGGRKLLGLAADGVRILTRGRRASPGELIQTAGSAFEKGTDLAGVAGNLKLKERAWSAMKNAADAIEANFKSEAEQQRKARYALEKAWDNHANCPACGVAFGQEDTACRVCGTGRPEMPVKSDPRAH